MQNLNTASCPLHDPKSLRGGTGSLVKTDEELKENNQILSSLYNDIFAETLSDIIIEI